MVCSGELATFRVGLSDRCVEKRTVLGLRLMMMHVDVRRR